MSTKRDCNFCSKPDAPVPATVDGKTTFGPWAYMCDACHEQHGVGLGTGRGQRLPGAGVSLAKAPEPALTGAKLGSIYERQEAGPHAAGSVHEDIAGMSIDDMFDYFGDTDPMEFL